MTKNSLFSKLYHIGIIVRDLDKTIEYYKYLGIEGPFEPVKNVVRTERRVLGQPVDVDAIKNKTVLVKVGPIHLELIQPVEGDPSLSLWRKFLESKGEGINHLAFLVDDFEGELAKLKEKGFKVLYETRFQDGGGAAYFDTGDIGGVLLEIVQWPPQTRR